MHASLIRAVACRPKRAGVRRPALFAASLYLLTRAKRIVEEKGVQAAKDTLMRAWTADDANAPTESTLLDEIDVAIDSACQWLPVQMNCLPRSITAYVLADALGARPVHQIGVRARPYYGHAWTEAGGRVIGDALEPLQRTGLRIVKRFPAHAERSES